MRRTSIEAYNHINSNGLLHRRSWQVYDELYRNGPMTQNECWRNICAEFNTDRISKQSINPRFSELRRRGVVAHVINGKRICTVTGITCMTWDVTEGYPKKAEKQPSLKEKYAEALCQIAELKAQILAISRSNISKHIQAAFDFNRKSP